MTTIATIHSINQAHLEDVIADMETMGAPTIRVYNTGDMMIAIEGVHRIAAAAELGLLPTWVEVAENDEITDHGFADHEGETLTVAEILDIIGQPVGRMYDTDMHF